MLKLERQILKTHTVISNKSPHSSSGKVKKPYSWLLVIKHVKTVIESPGLSIYRFLVISLEGFTLLLTFCFLILINEKVKGLRKYRKQIIRVNKDRVL